MDASQESERKETSEIIAGVNGGDRAAAWSPYRAGRKKECSLYSAFWCIGASGEGEKDIVEVGSV